VGGETRDPRCTGGYAHVAGEEPKGGVGPRCTDGPSLDGKRGWREEVAIHVAQMAPSCRRVWGRRGLEVVSEDTLPRCTKEHRLLTRRAGKEG
jgi:hypothetical protein